MDGERKTAYVVDKPPAPVRVSLVQTPTGVELHVGEGTHSRQSILTLSEDGKLYLHRLSKGPSEALGIDADGKNTIRIVLP